MLLDRWSQKKRISFPHKREEDVRGIYKDESGYRYIFFNKEIITKNIFPFKVTKYSMMISIREDIIRRQIAAELKLMLSVLACFKSTFQARLKHVCGEYVL